MSGHSKWAKIKRKKGANDEARGKLFTKLSKNITIAAQQGGGDPDMNFGLRVAIDKAKANNLPADRIDKAIKRGTGEDSSGQMVSINYEGYGPANVAIIITCQTDNTNRALTEVKQIVQSSGGKLVPEGSVSWQFEEKGVIMLLPEVFEESEKFGKEGEYKKVDPEDLVLELMEIAGVDDVISDPEEEEIIVYTERNQYSDVHKKFIEKGYKIEESDLGWVAKESIDLSDQESDKLAKLLEDLDESDEVANVWHNG